MNPQRLTEWREALGGRRFLITVGAGVVNTALLIGAFITENVYAQLTFATVAVYIAGRAYTEVKTNAQVKINDRSDSSPTRSIGVGDDRAPKS
jgi:hypothetical protein